jgi:hypothetical protein
MYNIYTIIKNVTDLIKEEIHTVEVSLMKIKTFKSDDVSLTINVYIYIYAFAFLTQLIYTNDFISFKGNLFVKEGGRAVIVKDKKVLIKDKKPIQAKDKNQSKKDIPDLLKTKVENTKENVKELQKLINVALSLLIKIKNKDIQESKVITFQNIKELFLKAYRWILNINYTAISYSKKDYWYNNHVISYFRYAFVHNLDNKSGSSETQKGFVLKDVLGRSEEEIEKDFVNKKGIYDTLVNPGTWTKNKYINDSLLYVYEYIHNKIYTVNYSDDNPIYLEFFKKYSYLKELENDRRIVNKFITFRPYYRTLYVHSYITNTMLKHNFTNCKDCKEYGKLKYVYQKINDNGQYLKDTKTLELKEVNELIESKDFKKAKEFRNWILIEIKCSCTINKKANIKDQKIEAFYEFYKNKCVFGGIHDFNMVKNQQTCIKCGITEDIITNHDEKFYKKYTAIYNKVREIEYQNIKPLVKTQKVSKLTKVVKETYKKWENTNRHITKLATMLDISPNVIYNIGMYEKRDYNKDKFNKTVLSFDKEIDDEIKRNNNLYDYYLYIIRNYYLLRNSEFVSSQEDELKGFLAKFSNTDISRKLSIINRDFIKSYRYYKKVLSSSLLTNFLLNSISETLIKIFDEFTKGSLKKMGTAWVTMIFNNIIKFEKKLTTFDIKKVLRIKMSLFDESLNDAVNIDDANIDELDDSTKANDLEVDDEFPIEDEDHEDQFSMANIDVEMDDEENLYKDVADRD